MRGAILIALPALLLAGQARADDLQSRLLADMRATRPETYAFRRTVVIERTGAARKTVVEQFDPRRAPADRWTLLTVDGRAPTPKELAEARKSKRGPVPSYANPARWFGAPATRTDTGPGQVTYRFARLPKGTVQIGSHDASADVATEAVVNTHSRVPYVERVRFTSTKGFRMMLVASVKTMVLNNRFRQLPDGRVVPGQTTSDMTGSLLGKSGQLKTTMTFTDVQAVR